MLPHKHVIISIAIGTAGWWGTGDVAACIAPIIAGVLPDLDHIADYAYFRQRSVHRLILPLHGYEYALLGVVAAWLTRNAVLGITTLSYLVHLLTDQQENRTHRLGYSLLFRARHRFRIEPISTTPEAAVQGRLEDMQFLKKLLRH